jgi:formylglycine-generating enzyme required for sulfatase activity
MARIEKTVFISYRRKDISWALAVYQYLTSQKYDVFFDYTSLSGGDFEQVIVSNIRARAHFVLILTPTALDRCSQPGDWLRREIETAIGEKRNIVPLFFDGFSFDSPSVTEKLTGKLGAINRYNGLDIPSGYFMEGMERLDERYLNIPLDAVIHPVSGEVGKVVRNEQKAANKAVLQRKDIKHLAFPVAEREKSGAKSEIETGRDRKVSKAMERVLNLRPYGIGTGILLIAILGIVGVNSLIKTITAKDTLTPTEYAVANTSIPTHTRIIPTNTATTIPPTPVTTLGVGSAMISPKDGMTMLYVPAGEFGMGSDTGADEEKPVHTVYLDAFWIDRTEVTNSMYANCVQVGRCGPPALSSSYTRESYFGNVGYDDYPAVNITWFNADLYCEWAGRRLPTEAEWEKAAGWDEVKQRKYVYPWGNSINCVLANFGEINNGCVGDTTEVGTYLSGKSPYGALDMAGNVLEWVNDWYDENYYSVSPTSNPLGPDSGQYRVFRGGSWGESWWSQRVSWRGFYDPSKTWYNDGFRCAMSASE